MSGLINFDGNQQNTRIHKAIAEALHSLEPSLQQQSSQSNDSHQVSSKYHRDNDDDERDDSYEQVPIDPSISEVQHEQETQLNDETQKVTDVTTQELAQAAVEQSNVKLTKVGTQVEKKIKITKPRTNKPGQRFGAKKKSWVWKWFIQDPIDCNVATCEYCGKVITRLSSDKGSPKKLGEHLKTHKIDKDAVNSKRDSFQNTLGPNPTPGGSGPNQHPTNDTSRYFNTINTTQQQFKEHQLAQEQTNHIVDQGSQNHDLNGTNTQVNDSSYSQARFQKDLMKFLVENKLPLSIVKSSSFKQIIYSLKPEAINALTELNHLYTSLVDVLNAGKESTTIDTTVHEAPQEVDVQIEHGDDVHDDHVDADNDADLEPSANWV